MLSVYVLLLYSAVLARQPCGKLARILLRDSPLGFNPPNNLVTPFLVRDERGEEQFLQESRIEIIFGKFYTLLSMAVT
jgi:hypothetical protein